MPISDLLAGFQSGYDQAQVGKKRRADNKEIAERNKQLDEMDPGRKEELGWAGSQKKEQTPGNWFTDFIAADLKTEQRPKNSAQKLAVDEEARRKEEWDKMLPIRQQQAKTAELAKQIQMTGVMEKLKLSEQALMDTQEDQKLDSEWKAKRAAMTDDERLSDTAIPAFKTPKFLGSGYQQILRDQNSVAAKAAAQKAIQDRQSKILEQRGDQSLDLEGKRQEGRMQIESLRNDNRTKIATMRLQKLTTDMGDHINLAEAKAEIARADKESATDAEFQSKLDKIDEKYRKPTSAVKPGPSLWDEYKSLKK